MKYTAKLVSSSVEGNKSEMAKTYGYIYMIGMRCGGLSKERILSFDRWLSQAVNHQQIMMVFDSALSPVGFVTWAYLDQETEQRYLLDQEFCIHPLEWNEGDNAWVIDFHCPKGGLWQMARLLRDRLRADAVDKLHWKRRVRHVTKFCHKKVS